MKKQKRLEKKKKARFEASIKRHLPKVAFSRKAFAVQTFLTKRLKKSLKKKVIRKFKIKKIMKEKKS